MDAAALQDLNRRIACSGNDTSIRNSLNLNSLEFSDPFFLQDLNISVAWPDGPPISDEALELIPIRRNHIRRCGSNSDIRWEGSHRGRCRCLPKACRRFGSPFFATCF